MTRVLRRAAAQRRVVIAATVAALAIGGYLGATALTSSGGAGETPVIVTATGDLGGSTSELRPVADLMGSLNPDRILLLGDLCYGDGTPECYANVLGPVYGPYKAKTIAAPGNHDYHSGNQVAGFFGTYPDALPRAVDLANGWTVIVINTEVSHGAGSTMETAVRDLANSAKARGRHIIAITHHPRYTGGSSHGDDTALDAIVGDLDTAGADLFLAGHNHIYERFQPMGTGGGLRSEGQGIRFFTVGTGGNGLYSCTSHTGRQTCIDNKHGALRLELNSNSFGWSFKTTDGQTLDAGSAPTRSNGVPPSTTSSSSSTSSSTSSTSSSTSSTTSSTTTTTLPGSCLTLPAVFGLNQYPFVFRSGTCATGGTAWGLWPYSTTPWETLHGTAAYTDATPGFTLAKSAAVNYGDSYQIKPGANGFTLDRVYGAYGHDDFIENDAGMAGTVTKSLGESFVIYSDQGEDPTDQSGHTVTLDGNLLILSPTPTVYKGPDTTYNKYRSPGTGGFFKLDANSARIVLRNNLFSASVIPNHQDLNPPPPSKLAACSGNVVVWRGAGDFPGRAAWMAQCPDTVFLIRP